MNLSKPTINRLLLEIGSIYNYEMIITGSCADMFHINYEDIEDIDFIIDEVPYSKYKDVSNPFKQNVVLIQSLKHKKDNHVLHRYLYGIFKYDLLIKNESLIPKDIVEIQLESQVYKIFSAKERYNQLLNNSYKKIFSDNYEKKIIKVAQRIKSYEQLLGIKSSDSV